MDQLVVLLALIAAVEPATLEQQSLQQAAAQAWKVDELADTFARRHTTEEQRRYVGNAALVTRIIVERKVTFEVRF